MCLEPSPTQRFLGGFVGPRWLSFGWHLPSFGWHCPVLPCIALHCPALPCVALHWPLLAFVGLLVAS
jgi:hypothetical protein